MTAPLDEARLRELAEAATPGPWSTCVRMGGDAIVDAPTRPVARVDYRRDETERDRDAAFIAAANPSTILALLDALSAERARGDRASSVMARVHNAIGSGKYDRATVRQWLTDGINYLATQKAEDT